MRPEPARNILGPQDRQPVFTTASHESTEGTEAESEEPYNWHATYVC